MDDVGADSPCLLLQVITVSRKIGVPILLGKTGQTDGYGRNSLCKVVMKLLSNVITFRFLGVNQLGADRAELFFSVFAISEVHSGTDIAEKSSIGTISRNAIMKQPSI